MQSAPTTTSTRIPATSIRGCSLKSATMAGRMVDFGSAAHGDYFSITDTYDPLSNRRAFYDTSYVLPAAMLESYVEKWPTPRPENFLYMLRSGMMGWVTIMLDTTAWTPQQHEAARAGDCALQGETAPADPRCTPLPYLAAARRRALGWDGVLGSTSAGQGVVYAFRGNIADEDEHRFVLAGLEAGSRYRLHFQDGSAPDREAAGRELMEQGLAVRLGMPLSSELVFLEAAKQRSSDQGSRRTPGAP